MTEQDQAITAIEGDTFSPSQFVLELLYRVILPFGSFAIGIAIPLWPIVLDARLRFDAWWSESLPVPASAPTSFSDMVSVAADLLNGPLFQFMFFLWLITALVGVVLKASKE
jgi:hypothetical protein